MSIGESSRRSKCSIQEDRFAAQPPDVRKAPGFPKRAHEMTRGEAEPRREGNRLEA